MASPATSTPRAAHFQVPGHSGHPASGDLTSLQVREDGTAELVTTTDAFTAEDLQAGAKTAIIIHEKADNFANIPPERYQQVNGTPPPDETTMATGDAGKRVACGVIGTGLAGGSISPGRPGRPSASSGSSRSSTPRPAT